MTLSREDLIRQRDAIDAQLAKLDATFSGPWEDQFDELPDCLLNENYGYSSIESNDAETAVEIYKAVPQLIACVRALRGMREHINKRQEYFVSNICATSVFDAATKALEELDAL